MITRLSIRNFVIVPEMELDLASGFTVLTGETGAGKSILLDAIGLLLGERSDVTLVAQGADKADISGEFILPATARTWLIEQDLFEDDEALIIRRTIDKQGKSRAFINGIAVTLSQLRDLTSQLVNIHGQHAHQLLLKPALQRELLDHHAQLGDLRQAVKTAYTQWQELEEKRNHAEQDMAQMAARVETLHWQLEGLNLLAPKPNEFDSLSHEHARLSHASTLIEGTAAARYALTGDENPIEDQLRSQINHLTELAELDERLAPVVQMLDSALINLQEASSELGHYASRADLDESRWDEIDSRMSLWMEQSRKLRTTPEALPELWQNLRQELDTLEGGLDLEGLTAQVATAQAAFQHLAQTLSAARHSHAQTLAAAVTASMQTLSMVGGQFDISVQPTTASSFGIDAVEFKVAGHAGVPLQALHKVASGGELARISLAISVITSAANPVPTLIFDEVDSGIGGAVAEVVGRLLAQIGQQRQVLCVTHLAQVAAQGKHQWRVRKTTQDGTTQSGIDILSAAERVDEIARMIGGVTITEATREHAREMLAST